MTVAPTVPLQVSWFIDYVPRWLGPTLLGVGLLLVVLTFLSFTISGSESRSLSLGTVALGSAGLGVGLLVVPLYRNHTYIFAAGFLLAGRWIEGVAATRLLSKAIRFFSGSGSGSLTTTLKRRLRRLGIVLFVVILAIWAATWVVLLGPVVVTRAYDLTLIWTVCVGVLSVLGLGFKFATVDNRVYGVDLRFLPMVVGLILAVVGAQLYNFELLSQVFAAAEIKLTLSALDPVVLILGNVAYLAGYYWSIRQRLAEVG